MEIDYQDYQNDQDNIGSTTTRSPQQYTDTVTDTTIQYSPLKHEKKLKIYFYDFTIKYTVKVIIVTSVQFYVGLVIIITYKT